MSDFPDPDQLQRIARQHARTSQLLGVEIMPLAPAAVERPPRRSAASAAPSPSAPAPVEAAARASSSGASRPGAGKAAALAALRARYERESSVAASIEGWSNIVFSDGWPDAPLMFIGEAPGADEDASGVPFVGRAGQKLNEMIRAMKLDRAAEGQRGVYIANVLKVRPPNNRTPTPEEAMADGVFLEEQIRIVGPRVIVTLGKPAANYLLRSNETMGSMRGVWHEFEGIPVMPTYHPAYLLRAYTPENRRRVWSDLQQALAKLRELGAIDF